MSREEEVKTMIKHLENNVIVMPVQCSILNEISVSLAMIADSLRSKAEWISQDEDDLKISNYRCSNCGHYQDDVTNYCPDCGAEMK